MAIVSSLFIRWGITKFTFRAYIVQFDGDSNSVKSSKEIYYDGEYYYTLHLIRWLFTCFSLVAQYQIVIWLDGEYRNILRRNKFIMTTWPSLSLHQIVLYTYVGRAVWDLV